MRQIPLNCVKSGTLLAKPIYNSTGNILLKEGVELNPALLERISENGIQTLYIKDGYSDSEIEDIIKPELRQKTVKAIKETFTHIIHSNVVLSTEVTDLKRKLMIKGMQKYLSTLSQLSETIIADISSKKNLMINLVDIKNIDNHTYEHSLSVAILSLILGIELKLSNTHLRALFIGALLHDIGKAFIPAEITNKKDELTVEEFEVFKTHPTYGYNYIKENYSLDSNSKVTVLQHHENYDGSGYPRGTSGEHINRLARIVNITNTYDNLTSDSPSSKALAPNEAIEYIMGSAGRYFDFQMADTFVKKIVPYPPGTLVRLSNDLIGVVKEVHPNFPLRPTIQYIEIGTGRLYEDLINLMYETNITILGVQIEDPKYL